ncbi:hypothetical protein GCM10022247_66570 [Allokutzneria multivorans]|uniref:Peptide chain release factor domain-containing protein n=1 Tax=Allokutzneria multivorans TaxID=1142134 RepID=A0ABP7TW83_9PSEU
MFEDVLSEYADLESSLAAPSVLRDHLRARRLRRCLAALAPLHAAVLRLRAVEEDLAAAVELELRAEAEQLSAQVAELRDDLAARLALRDPRDPLDVIVFIEGDTHCVALLAGRYRDLAEERGWTVQDLQGWHGPTAAFAVTAREGAEGPWATLKHETEASARVTVVPEGPDMPTLREDDLRLDHYCTRQPGQPPSVKVTHLPTGIGVRGTGTHPIEARTAALRQIRARLAAITTP